MARMIPADVYAPQELHEQIEAYRTKRELDSTAEAWRELARRGLQAQEVSEA